MFGFQSLSEAALSTLADQDGNEIFGEATFEAEAFLTFLAGKLKTGALDILATADLEVLGRRLRGSSAFMTGEAFLETYGGAIRYANIMIEGEAFLYVTGGINGTGWVRIAPDTPEWDYLQSSKWNKIN
jgi:hypothetical protein